jgi:hypothetical protein
MKEEMDKYSAQIAALVPSEGEVRIVAEKVKATGSELLIELQVRTSPCRCRLLTRTPHARGTCHTHAAQVPHDARALDDVARMPHPPWPTAHAARRAPDRRARCARVCVRACVRACPSWQAELASGVDHVKAEGFSLADTIERLKRVVSLVEKMVVVPLIKTVKDDEAGEAADVTDAATGAEEGATPDEAEDFEDAAEEAADAAPEEPVYERTLVTSPASPRVALSIAAVGAVALAVSVSLVDQ